MRKVDSLNSSPDRDQQQQQQQQQQHSSVDQNNAATQTTNMERSPQHVNNGSGTNNKNTENHRQRSKMMLPIVSSTSSAASAVTSGASTSSSSSTTTHCPASAITPITPLSPALPAGSDPAEKPKALILELTINRDKFGYGMKVSGETPVFVDSVKDGGAAHRAGLHASDMILRVNGNNVRFCSHAEVVQLMKATQNVELTVQRSGKPYSQQTTPTMTPTTPTSQRNSITAPLPVDHLKRKEVEFTKLQTLSLYLDQERKNLEKLRNTSGQDANIVKAETTIRTLENQLKQTRGEGSAYLLKSINNNNNISINNKMPTPLTMVTSSPIVPVTTPTVSAPFLSRFPRSLSQLNLGSKRKSSTVPIVASTTEIKVQQGTTNPATASPGASSSSSTASSSAPISAHSTPISSPSSHQKALQLKQMTTKSGQQSYDIPPPLPRRNQPRKSLPNTPGDDKKFIQISDLDSSLMMEFMQQQQQQQAAQLQAHNTGAVLKLPSKKKPKSKVKAWSDPKMSTQMFLQMEAGNYPPPLPPRHLIQLSDDQFGQVITNKDYGDGGSGSGERPLPNSVNTLLNYPLISTLTAIRDNMSPSAVGGNNPFMYHQHQEQHHHHHHHPHQQHQMTSSNQSLTDSAINYPSKQSSKHKSSPEYRKKDSNKTKDANEITPPGTPPPPYHANQSISAAQSNVEQKQIISFECDNETDDELMVEDNSVFKSISSLTAPEHISYLVVFLNFVLSNSNPAAILFYLITDLYKKGNVKDMRKWAYEIHSTFLVPTAPMYLSFFPEAEAMAEALARDIDDKLAQAKAYQILEKSQQEFEMAGILRNVFQKSRAKARDIINQQLEEFQEKRTAGLGTMYGPSAAELLIAKGDKVREQKIVEDHLIPKLQQYLDEMEKDYPIECPQKLALCSALSTVVHRIFLIRSTPYAVTEKVHHYVTREKSFKTRIMSKNRKALVRGHHFTLHQYYEVQHCNHCQNLIWGVSPQGFQCSHCELNIHRSCSKLLEENCPGPAPRKSKDAQIDNKFTKIMDKIRPNAHSAQNERKKQEEEAFAEDIAADRSASFSTRPNDFHHHHRPSHPSSNQLASQDSCGGSLMMNLSGQDFVTGSGGSGSTSGTNNNTVNSGSSSGQQLTSHNASGSLDASLSEQSQQQGLFAGDNRRLGSKPKTVQANARSESYKECSPKRSRTHRPKSDPSLYEDDNQTLGDDDHHPQQSQLFHTAKGVSLESNTSSSEDETFGCELEADWSSAVDPEVLGNMSDAEKKRQEIINEIYQTERNHVRTLKVLEGVFMNPLINSGYLPTELSTLLFPPALSSLKNLHNSFENNLKQRKIEHNSIVGDIGDLLLSMFHGPCGEELKEHAAIVCARQQLGLEALKEKRKKDDNLQRLLNKAESHKACRRLQLKDLLPTVLQRLTKYPLLFERLHKITDNEKEAAAIKLALLSSKSILDHVNRNVRNSEELRTIQKKLDKSSYDKDAPNEFKNIDLTQYKLIHDGPLTIKKNPSIQLHGLLFENMIVLLQKQEDKYILKHHVIPDSKAVNPINKINLTLVRLSAVDKRTFFLILIPEVKDSHMVELTAPDPQACTAWIHQISEAAERYKARLKRGTSHKQSTASAPLCGVLLTQPDEPLPVNDELIDTQHVTESQQQSQPSVTVPGDNKLIISVENPTDGIENDEEPDCEDPNKITNNNDTVTSTQPSQLILPTEIHVSVSPVMRADRIVMPSELLRRLGATIRESVHEMERIICDMNRVPVEHFEQIADIAGQPEAPQELADLALASFAQTNYLIDCVQHAMSADEVVKTIAPTQLLTNVIGDFPELCDNCFKNDHNTTVTEPDINVKGIDVEEDEVVEGLYCEIDNLTSPPKDDDTSKEISHMEINENYDTSKNVSDVTTKVCEISPPMTPPMIAIGKISGCVVTLNNLISQLTIKIADRDTEREIYRRENQRLQDHVARLEESLNGLQLQHPPECHSANEHHHSRSSSDIKTNTTK